MGERPTHPELLDWLAREFVASGWSMKQMHRLIMNFGGVPAVVGVQEGCGGDRSGNRLLWAFPRQRLEGEVSAMPA